MFKPTKPGELVSIVALRTALQEALDQLNRADLDVDQHYDAIELGVLTSNVIARAYQLSAEDR